MNTIVNRLSDGLKCLALTALVVGLSSAPANAGEILEVVLDSEERGVLNIGTRDSAGQEPVVKVAGEVVEVTIEERAPARKWQPLFMIVDTTNISEERLDKVKRNVVGIAQRELGLTPEVSRSKMVVVSNQSGVGVEASQLSSVDKMIKPTLGQYEVIANPDPKNRKPHYSTISPFLGRRLSNVPVARAQPWALVFSSLCVGPEDEPPESLKGFKGPIRFLTWDQGLHSKCLENREGWLAKLREMRDGIEVYNLDEASPESIEAVKTARLGRTDVLDEILSVSGLTYPGGLIEISVELEGSEGWGPQQFSEDSVPEEWAIQAQEEVSRKTRIIAAFAFIALVFLVIVIAIIKARSGGMEVAKWEAVGEAEALSESMDPDAWNATIFQLTGAMPALKEIREAAQLGPSADAPEKPMEPTVDAPIPEDAGAPAAAKAASQEAPAEASAAAKTSSTTSSPALPEASGAAGSPPSTGMTVAMPVLDDGTGYDADVPFEVGVLLNGKPVARKTKKFRKVFSVGRATDNRVVIQRDDTVHRYHVVVRPALQGKEWWLEVSPTATNRTNLNGKELRPGGRYRLPARFRLQLGEATEVRGRMATS